MLTFLEERVLTRIFREQQSYFSSIRLVLKRAPEIEDNLNAIHPWNGKRILLVDDYPSIRKSIKELLLGLELECSEAENGVQALDILKRNPFDLVITDLVMPEMDGFELTEAIKTSPAIRFLPVVILSTHADSRYIFKALRLGADDYLTKPTTKSMLTAVLYRMFDHEW